MKSEIEFLEFICPAEYMEGENEIGGDEQWIRDRIQDRLKALRETI